MKMIKKMIIWLMAATVFQLGIYLYLDRVVLVPQTGFTQQAVGGETANATTQYSYDNSFFAQITDRKVKFYASGGGLVKEVSLQDNEELSYFSWLPDRNLALLGINRDGAGETTAILESVNPETNSQPITPKIKGLAKGSRIADVAFSTQTNVINIMINYDNHVTVYRTDANNELRRVHLGMYKIRRIASLQSEDALLYDSISKGKVYLLDAKEERHTVSPGDGRYALLGVDKEDNIYLGKLGSDGLVASIVKGKLDDRFNGSFAELKKLDSPYPVDYIRVTYDGKLVFK